MKLFLPLREFRPTPPPLSPRRGAGVVAVGTCTYRSIINQSSSHTFGTDAYGSTVTATQSSGDGTYYLHVQAKDADNNESAVVSVSAVLDNTSPDVTGLSDDNVATRSKSWNWGCSENPCTYRSVVNQSASHTFSSEAYSPSIAASQSSGDGMYYLHVQAKDAVNNESSVVSVSAVLDNTAPTATVARANGETGDVSGAFNVTITFSEAVEGFDLSDIAVGDGSASALTGSGDAYGATITPDSNVSSVSVDVAAGAASDSAGNASEAASTLSVSVESAPPGDTTPPLVTGLADDSAAKQSKSWSWGCSESSCTYRHAINQNPAHVFTSEVFGSDVSASQSSGDGTYYLHVQAQDAANNASAVVSVSAVLDNTAPSTTVARANGETGAVSGPFNVVITFSESVSDFVLSDLSVTRGTASALTGSGASYGATITPNIGERSRPEVRVRVHAGVATDSAGNGNTDSGHIDVSVTPADTTPPTISGLIDDSTVAQSKSWSWGCNETCTYRFVVNQNASHTFSNEAYSSTASASRSSGDGTYYLHVQAKDAADNASAVVSVSVVLDNTAPSVTGLADDSVGAPSKQWTWGCSESSCTYRSAVNQSSSHSFSSGDAYGSTTTATQSTGDGTYYLHVQAKDGAGNESAVASFSAVLSQAVFAVTGISSDATPAQSKTWNWGCSDGTCTYRHAVNQSSSHTFSNSDSYSSTATATQSTGDGTYYLHVQAKDAADNASAVASVSAVLDNTAPTATVARANGETGAVTGAFNVAITFSESVSGFALSDISVARGAASALTGSGASYGATITPNSGETSVRVSVAASVATDGAGNNNAASGNLDVTVTPADTTPPTVSGLSDDSTVAQSKSWSWGCNETCTYRHAVNQSSSHTFANSAAYGSTTSASQTSGDGTYYLHVQAKDAADNASAVVSVSAVLDNTDPTVTLTRPGAVQVGGDGRPYFTLDIAFSEDVTGLADSDVSVINGSFSGLRAVANSARNYKGRVTFNANQNSVSVSLPANAAQDGASNGNAASSSLTATWTPPADTTAPTVQVARSGSGSVTGAFDVTITFSENVTGFALGDITVSNGTASDLTGSGSSYGATITPNSGETSVTVSVAAGVATDGASNANTASNSLAVTITNPSAATVSFSQAGNTFLDINGGLNMVYFNVNISFNKDVTGFTSSDLEVTNGYVKRLWAPRGGRRNYRATVYSSTVDVRDTTVSLPADRVQSNGVGNRASSTFKTSQHIRVIDPGSASGTRSLGTYNNPHPGLSIVRADGLSTTLGADPFDLTITFVEDVSGLTPSDFTISGGSIAVKSGTNWTGPKSVYTATVTPSSGQTRVSVKLRGGRVQDGDNNGNMAYGDLPGANDAPPPFGPLIVPVDTVDPSVAVARVQGESGAVRGAFDVTIRFSHDVTGFVLGDLTVQNGSASNLVTESARNYRATITPNNGVTAVRALVAANVAQRPNGRNNRASVFLIVTVDTAAPTVAVSRSNGETGGVAEPFGVDIRFSEDVSGFEIGDLTVTGGTASNFRGSGRNYSATITFDSGASSVSVKVNAGVATDHVSHSNTASNTLSVNVNRTPATVTVRRANRETGKVNGPFDVDIIFNKDVTGFALTGLTVNNGTASGLVTGSARGYRVTITPTGTTDTTVTISVAAGAAQDSLGTGSAASNSLSVSVDKTPPTISSFVRSDGLSTVVAGPFYITITFSEDVENFALARVGVQGGSAPNISGSGDTYQVRIVPSDTATEVVVSLSAGIADDLAGNANAVAPSSTLTVPVTLVSTLSLQTSSPGTTLTPTLRVEGGRNGHVFKVYSKRGCADADEVASGSMPSSGTTTKDVTSSALKRNTLYRFYHKMAANSGDLASADCVPSMARYTTLFSYSSDTVSAGYAHSCAVSTSGGVKCWGSGGNGELGNDGSTESRLGVDVVSADGQTSLLDDIVQVAVGGDDENSTRDGSFSCALTSDRKVKCWGAGRFGQTGRGEDQCDQFGACPRYDNVDAPAIVKVARADESDTSNPRGTLTGVTSLSVGGGHACVIDKWREIICWGKKANGRLGEAPANDRDFERHYAKRLSGTKGALQLSAGRDHTCALMYDGTVRCWGKGDDGRLGNGTASDSTSLATVQKGDDTTNSTLGDIMQVAAGGEHSCALDENGEVWCWGKTANKRLGYTPSSTETHITRAKKVAGLSGIVQLSAGGAHTCALNASGEVQCWGKGTEGQLGNNGTSDSHSAVTVKAASGNSAADLSSVAWLDAGRDHTCAVLTSGQARCWGKGANGRLGDNATSNRSYAVSVKVASGSNTVAMASLSQQPRLTCAAASIRNQRKCWESSMVDPDNLNNQLLLTSSLQGGHPEPAAVVNFENYHCVLTAWGRVKCWGKPSGAMFNNGGSRGRVYTSPFTINNAGGQVRANAVYARGAFVCFETPMGNISCQGNAHRASNEPPVFIQTGTISSPVRDVSQFYGSICVVRDEGRVYCAGTCDFGQLGHKVLTPETAGDCGGEASLQAVKTAESGNPPLKGAIRVHTATYSGCAIMADKRAMCWGAQQNGVLGNGQTSRAIKLAGYVGGATPLEGVVQLASETQQSGQSMCALLENGGVKCWGTETRAGYGQLGTGARRTTASGTPLDVVTAARTSSVPNPTPLTGAIQISAGKRHYCALLKSGQVRCWGWGSNGRLGNGKNLGSASSIVPYAAPVVAQTPVSGLPVIPLEGVAEIVSNEVSTCALMLSGGVKCWGESEERGILGTRESSRPVTVPRDVFAGSSGSALFNIFN